jgi:heptosyltransferase-3
MLTDEPIVIYRLGSMGDTVVALPCFHKIAQRFPGAERILLTNFPVNSLAAPLEAILGNSKLISRCIEYRVSSRSASEFLDLRRRLRATGAKTLVYLAASRGLLSAWRDLIFFKACGFRHVIGIPLTDDLQENRTEATTGLVEPECKRLARTMAELGAIDLHDLKMWDLLLTPEELAAGDSVRAQFKGLPFIAIHVGGKTAEKDWGENNWRKLLRTVSESHRGYGLLLVGAPDDEERYRQIAPEWSSPVIDACGMLTPRQCAAALRHARLFVGHDSGPLHLASISGVACVGLFGSFNSPRKWHPYIGTHRIIHRVDGISRISVEEVADALRSLLPEKSQTAPM